MQMTLQQVSDLLAVCKSATLQQNHKQQLGMYTLNLDDNNTRKVLRSMKPIMLFALDTAAVTSASQHSLHKHALSCATQYSISSAFTKSKILSY